MNHDTKSICKYALLAKNQGAQICKSDFNILNTWKLF